MMTFETIAIDRDEDATPMDDTPTEDDVPDFQGVNPNELQFEDWVPEG